jgi:glycosyltransferase involved in cell wall biosynthesis
MRIAHITPTYFSSRSIVGGGERYVYNVARALTVAARDCNGFNQAIYSLSDQEDSFRLDDIAVRLLPIDWTTSSLMSSGSDRLRAALADCDLVHVHQGLSEFGLNALCIAKSCGKKVICTDLGGGVSPLMTKGGGISLADGIISISQYAAASINPVYRGPHLIVIGPVDTEQFRCANGQSRKELSGICVSRIMPHKGIDTIIRALPDDFQLTVVGSVYHEPYFELLRSLSKGKTVQFKHDVNDEQLIEEYSKAAIFLQASTYLDCYGNYVSKPELMGLTTLEAMSCGLPAIVSNVASLPELVDESRTGAVFGSVAELEKILTAIRQGSWDLDGRSKMCREQVESHFSYEAAGRKILTFYEQILNS